MQPGFAAWRLKLVLRNQIGGRLIERAGHDFGLGVAERKHLAAAGRAEAAVFVTRRLSLAFERRQRPDSIEGESRAARAPAVGAMAEAYA